MIFLIYSIDESSTVTVSWRWLYIYIYIYIYIVIHRQICFVLSELISVARQARFPKLGSNPGWLKRQSKILPLSREETSAREGNLNGYESQLLLFTYIRLTATESSIHMKSLAYTLMATQLLHSLESSTLYIYIYIYIYICVCVCILSSTDRLFRCMTTLQCD